MKVDGLDRAQPDCGSEYEAEQPHAAERCSEEIRILGTAGDDDIPIRKQNGHGIDAVAEAALRVMRLAVYVVGDVAGDCNELRSWRNHRKIRSRSWMNSLSRGAYVMYLVHYVFITWTQRFVLPVPMHAGLKFLVVFSLTLGLSWLTAQALIRIPGLKTIL